MELVKCNNAREAAVRAGDFLSQELVHFSDKPTLVLVSGGSSLAMLDYVNEATLRKNLSLGQVDERCTKDARFLNARLFRKTAFAEKTSALGIPFVAVDVSGIESARESAINYERYLKQWKSIFSAGIVIALLGIGSDGHIAGVMPSPGDQVVFDQLFYDTRAWVVGYETKGKGEFPSRVTLSLHFLLQEVTTAFVFACCKEKKAAIEKTLAPDGTFAETPARIINQMQSV